MKFIFVLVYSVFFFFFEKVYHCEQGWIQEYGKGGGGGATFCTADHTVFNDRLGDVKFWLQNSFALPKIGGTPLSHMPGSSPYEYNKRKYK